MLHLETSIVDFQLRRSREAKEAVCQRVEQIHHYLRHCAEVGMLLMLHVWKGASRPQFCRQKRAMVQRKCLIDLRVLRSLSSWNSTEEFVRNVSEVSRIEASCTEGRHQKSCTLPSKGSSRRIMPPLDMQGGTPERYAVVRVRRV